MKKTQTSKPRKSSNEMLPEYELDYRKARPNRFATRTAQVQRTVVVLDPDIAEVFTTPEAVNNFLRALIMAMPRTPKGKTQVKS